MIGSLFCPGPHYYYIIDFFDRHIKYMSDGITPILGHNKETVCFDDILNSMHPDDMEFVANAEKTAYDYLYQVLGKENCMKFKVSYCFRFKTTDGSYQLFNHQAIILSVDENYGFGKSLNIHTNIHHLTTQNNRKIHIIALYNDVNVIELSLDEAESHIRKVSIFSKREAEIVNLITLGFRNKEISEKLFLSEHTVKNHRKSILRKANVRSTMELVYKCLNDGLL
jgi:DNA-binding CsgD family transcriptional regulator